MERRYRSLCVVCLVTSSIVASPPPPPSFSGNAPMGNPFEAPSTEAPSFSAPTFQPSEAPSFEPRNESPRAENPFAREEGPGGQGSFGSRETESPFNRAEPSFERPPFGEHEKSFEREREPSGPPGFGSTPEENAPGAMPRVSGYPSSQAVPPLPYHQQNNYSPYQNHPQHDDVQGIQQAEEALEKQDTIVQEGINSFDVEGSGNWLLKRVWWEKTEEVYQEIKAVFNQVLETRMQFIATRNKLDRELDIFYGEMGLEQGPLHDIITHTLDLMEKMRKAQGDVLTPKEEDLVKRTQEKEPVLAQLKLDVKAIQAVEDKLDQALNTLFKQVDVCNEYEQRAWTNFKDIARELNDKEARKSYYQTVALLEDTKKIQSYLTGAFSTYFEQTVQSARDHAHKITTNMQNLRNQGIDLQKEALILENDRDVPQPKVDLKKKEELKKKQQQEVGFFGKIAGFFKSIFSWFTNLFGSGEAQVKKAGKKIKKETDKEVAVVEQDVKRDTKTVEQKAEQLKKDLEQDYQAGHFGMTPHTAHPQSAHDADNAAHHDEDARMMHALDEAL